MNIYAIKGSGNYSGGLAIIVAETPEQAKQIASQLDNSNDYGYLNPDSVEKLNVPGWMDSARVLVSLEHSE